MVWIAASGRSCRIHKSCFGGKFSTDTRQRKRVLDLFHWQDDRNSSKAGPGSPDLKYHSALESLCTDTFCPDKNTDQRASVISKEASCNKKVCNQNLQESLHVVARLKAYTNQRDLQKGLALHADILKRGLIEKNSFVASALVNMYAKCGALVKAADVINDFSVCDVVSWNTLIAGYVQQKQSETALKCFDEMQNKGITPDTVTLTCILKACGRILAVKRGKQIHSEVVRRVLLENNITLGPTLVHMYLKFGSLADAEQVFDELPARSVVTWTSLITGFSQHGRGEEALRLFEQMQHEGVSPNLVTFIAVLKACTSIAAVDKGEQIHCEIVRQGMLQKEIVLGNALVDMYAKCGVIIKATQVLDELPIRSVVSWSAMIAGYANNGQPKEALVCFEQMKCEGLHPNSVTLICILKACGNIGAVDKGEDVHDEILRQGLLSKDIMLGTALVDMYATCGALTKAARVHEEFLARDVVSWSALISGYSNEGQGEEALKCFEQMQREGFSPTILTFTGILKACGSIAAASKGEQIHCEIVRQGLLGKDIVLGNTLVDMYVKCGVLAKAQEVLDGLPFQDVVTWSTLVAGYVQEGEDKEALRCFEQMQIKGFSPDFVTFSCVLSACSNSILLAEGETHYANMRTKYGITPGVEHYACMIDLFSKAGQFEKALALIRRTPSSVHLSLWLALLCACERCGNVEIAGLAFENAVQRDEGGATAFILMSKIYAAVGMQEHANHIEAMTERL